MKQYIKKSITAAIAALFILSISIVAFAASSVSGLPSEITLEVGEVTVWNPNPSGGDWTYDSRFLAVVQNGSLITVTPIKEGQTKAEYTLSADNDAATINITIVAKGTKAGSASGASSAATSSVATASSSSSIAVAAASSQVSTAAASSSEIASAETGSASEAAPSEVAATTDASSSEASSRVENPASGYSDTFTVIIAIVTIIAVALTLMNRKSFKH